MEKVFVYGTLRKGFGNHSVMARHEHKFIGQGKTDDIFRLTASGIPYVSKNNPVSQVVGEMYEVSKEVLEGPMDRLEGHPVFYKREKTPITLDDGTKSEAWLYFCEGRENATLIESGDYKNYSRIY